MNGHIDMALALGRYLGYPEVPGNKSAGKSHGLEKATNRDDNQIIADKKEEHPCCQKEVKKDPNQNKIDTVKEYGPEPREQETGRLRNHADNNQDGHIPVYI